MSEPLLLQRIYDRLSREYPHIAMGYESSHELLIHTTSEHGFDIVVTAGPQEHTMVFGPWHDHFACDEKGERELLQILECGLCELGRVKVTLKGKHTVRSVFEVVDDDGTWVVFSETGTLVFNPFAKTSIKYLQNSLVPKEDIRPVADKASE